MAPTTVNDTREAEVRAAEEARRIAMLQGDVGTLDRLLSDGLIYIHASGARDSKASWLARLAAGTLRYETLEFANPGVTVVNDTALVCAHMNAAVLRAGQPGQIACQYLAVWVRQPAGWQVVSVQGTPLPASQ